MEEVSEHFPMGDHTCKLAVLGAGQGEDTALSHSSPRCASHMVPCMLKR